MRMCNFVQTHAYVCMLKSLSRILSRQNVVCLNQKYASFREYWSSEIMAMSPLRANLGPTRVLEVIIFTVLARTDWELRSSVIARDSLWTICYNLIVWHKWIKLILRVWPCWKNVQKATPRENGNGKIWKTSSTPVIYNSAIFFLIIRTDVLNRSIFAITEINLNFCTSTSHIYNVYPLASFFCSAISIISAVLIIFRTTQFVRNLFKAFKVTSYKIVIQKRMELTEL